MAGLFERKPPQAQLTLVETIREQAGLTDPRILEAFLTIPREAFVPPEFAERAFDDVALPIGEEQTISQPSMLAIMLRELALEPGHSVLEVGSGSGYAAALLSRLVGSVHGVERQPELVQRARRSLDALGIENVTLHLADGSLGLTEFGPYDRILVSAGAASIPEALLANLRESGKLVMPVGSGEGQTLVTCERDDKGLLHYRSGTPCLFVPLVSGGIARR